MKHFLLPRSVFLLPLVASTALASDGPCVRSLLLSEHPRDVTHRVSVQGQVATTLRFEQQVDPSKSRMVGWEGRIAPLGVIQDRVVLFPTHDLDADEGIPLVVVLSDGTEIPFLLRPPALGDAKVDQQVDVYRNREGHAAVHAALLDALKKNDALTEENQRYRAEETSEDHALAALLAAGAVSQTPFVIADHFSGKDDETDTDATVFQGKGKVAVVFKIKNLGLARAWSMKTARLLTRIGGQERPVAVRVTRHEIVPGGAGVVAVVADGSAFLEDGKPTSLLLEIYRHDGLRQAFVQLEPILVAR